MIESRFNYKKSIPNEHVPYYFPTLDFKFQNTGTATGFFWQFAVEILQAKVDKTPALQFSSSIIENHLDIDAFNRGWGDAKACTIQIHDDILNRVLYDKNCHCFFETISTGQERTMSITKEDIDKNSFLLLSTDLLTYCAPILRKKYYEHLNTYDNDNTPITERISPGEKKKWRSDVLENMVYRITATLSNVSSNKYNPGELSRLLYKYVIDGQFPQKKVLPKDIRAILLNADRQLHITWQCLDDKKQHCQGQEDISLDNFPDHHSKTIYLSLNGFLQEAYLGAYADSDRTYVTVINPERGPAEYIYPLSRKIGSGDVDRFHIMVGSPMSAQLLLRFKFFLDTSTIIESEIFDIQIWNPHNSGWEKEYRDGMELTRD